MQIYCFAEDFIYKTVKTHISATGMTMRKGTIVDATLISAPSSTKNKTGKLDQEMHQTKQGNQWYYRCAEGYAYGIKVHAGVDKDSGLINFVVVTAAKEHDLMLAAELLQGDEDVVYGDAGYQRRDADFGGLVGSAAANTPVVQSFPSC